MAIKRHDRAKRILHLLLEKGRGSVEDLAIAVDASPASIRRDLIELEQRGLVNRTHGGAELPGQTAYEPFRFDAAFSLREERFADEKRRIALAAAETVNDGDTIALSANIATQPPGSYAAVPVAGAVGTVWTSSYVYWKGHVPFDRSRAPLGTSFRLAIQETEVNLAHLSDPGRMVYVDYFPL